MMYAPPAPPPIYTYTIAHDEGAAGYDEAMAIATIQGLINRRAPTLYILSRRNNRPAYWLATFSEPGQWLHGREQKALADLDAVVALAGRRLKGAIIWDPEVPASVNVATTMAGIYDAVVLSPTMAESCLTRWKLPVLEDLRGRFDGSVTGSAKNDAIRWSIKAHLNQGRCSSRLFCLFEDSYATRSQANIGYVVTRDLAVMKRAFTYDLSPWGDEVPGDDQEQPLGTDLATYKLLLEAMLRQSGGKHMTELAGFFAFHKYSNMPGHPSRHDPVPTEWETVWLISPYNCYQNTAASDCYNQSFHCHAPRTPLKQSRPAPTRTLENKTYLCILMADYDSALPLYDFLPNHWDDPARGRLPLCWGINPNLLDTYPDIIRRIYETATPNDHFAADASAAGYMNPNRIKPEHLPLFIRHNRKYYREADMSMSPMVLDWDKPSEAVKDAFRVFSPDGYATIVMDLHGTGGRAPDTQVWKGMPVTELINEACNFSAVDETAEIMSSALDRRSAAAPSFRFFRIVWTSPSNVEKTIDALRRKRPELNIEVVDPYTFFRLLKERLAAAAPR